MINLLHDNALHIFESLLSSSLPKGERAVLLHILSKRSSTLYEALLNNQSITLKSEQPLTPSTLMATIKKLEPNVFELINIISKKALLPKMIDLHTSNALFQQYEQFSHAKTTPSAHMLVQQLSQAETPESFHFISQQLLALRNDVIMLPLFFAQTEQAHEFIGYFQFKKRYNANKNQTTIHFFAFLQLLGEIEGTISLVNEFITLTLHASELPTLELLQQYHKEHPLPFRVHFKHQEASALFALQTTLLDTNA